MTDLTRRGGFTLVELLVVTLLGSVLLLAIYQTLVSNQRTYTIQADRVRAQDVVRSGMDILAQELREVSPSEGDIVAMSSDGLTIRSAVRVGLVCDVTLGSTPELEVRTVDGDFAVYDTVAVFADNETNIASDDVWIAARVTGTDTDVCGSDPVQRLSFGGQEARFTADSVRAGALIRSLRTRRYERATWNGEPYLVRIDESGTSPLVGPLGPSGPSFTYLDEDENVTSVPADVRQIIVELKQPGRSTDFTGDRVTASQSIQIYPRN